MDTRLTEHMGHRHETPASITEKCIHCQREKTIASKAAAALGRLGGKAGRGASQVRGDSEHYRAIRAKRPKPQVYESRGEWGGYTVREGLKGWIVDEWSAITGQRTGVRYLVGYDLAIPRTARLDAYLNDGPGAATGAELVLRTAREGPGVIRLLRRGHIVR